MTKKQFWQVAMLATVVVGCAPEDVPNSPSWDQDVYPILQGSCGHCHGATVGRVMGSPATRFDICSADAAIAAGIPAPVAGPLGATNVVVAATVLDQITVKSGKSRALMPPPPAAPLSDYENGILTKWLKRVMAATPTAGQPHPLCAKQTRNREPKAALLSKSVNEANELVVVLETNDPDGDQVIGKVSVGGSDKPIISSGRYAHVFPGAAEGSPVKVTLHDGYVASPVVVDF